MGDRALMGQPELGGDIAAAHLLWQSWLLCTSHEGTTAITASPLVDKLSDTIEDWERWLE